MSKAANAKAARLTATILRNLAAAPKPATIKPEAEVFRGLVVREWVEDGLASRDSALASKIFRGRK